MIFEKFEKFDLLKVTKQSLFIMIAEIVFLTFPKLF